MPTATPLSPNHWMGLSRSPRKGVAWRGAAAIAPLPIAGTNNDRADAVQPREPLATRRDAEGAKVIAAVEITPIRSVDKITVGNGKRGPITEAIQRTFFDIINGEKPDTHNWLTYVYPGEPLQAVGAGGSRSAAKK